MTSGWDTWISEPTLKPFDEQEQEALRYLGFTICITRGNDQLAAVTGDMKVQLHRSGEDRLALVIILPNGREIAELVRREMLQEILQEMSDEACGF